MERAIFITHIDQLDGVDRCRKDGSYTRLYFGIEFCERLIPSVEEFKRALDYSRIHNLDISLVTPYVTDAGLSKLSSLFDYLTVNRIDCEVIINDWGVLNLINKKYRSLKPVLGRLL